MKVYSPVAVRNAPTATARIIGYVNRTWSVSGGPGCRFGYARFYAGTWYAWGGKPNRLWGLAKFVHGSSSITGFIPSLAMHR